MSIDEQRRNALEELRDMLSEGVGPTEAVAAAAISSGLRPDVVTRIGERLIAERDNLISAKRIKDAASDRKLRAVDVIKLYEDALVVDPDADLVAIERHVQIDDFSNEEQSNLYLTALSSWLSRQVKN